MICTCIKGATSSPGPRGHEKIYKGIAFCPTHCLDDQPKVGYENATYRFGDGTLVMGEYGYVSDEEAFDDDTSEAIIVRETWTLTKREFKIINPRLCKQCEGDGEVEDPTQDEGCNNKQCDRCQGEGHEPEGADWTEF